MWEALSAAALSGEAMQLCVAAVMVSTAWAHAAGLVPAALNQRFGACMSSRRLMTWKPCRPG
jgi:hypothetical protein